MMVSRSMSSPYDEVTKIMFVSLCWQGLLATFLMAVVIRSWSVSFMSEASTPYVALGAHRVLIWCIFCCPSSGRWDRRLMAVVVSMTRWLSVVECADRVKLVWAPRSRKPLRTLMRWFEHDQTCALRACLLLSSDAKSTLFVVATAPPIFPRY